MKGKRMRTSLVMAALVQASVLALVAAKPVQSKPAHRDRALEARKVNDGLIDGMKAFANTQYAGWAMIIQFIGSLGAYQSVQASKLTILIGDTYTHQDVLGEANKGTNVVDIPGCRDLAPDQFVGKNAQIWEWNLDDSNRTPCQIFWLRGMPDATDGDKPIPGAFTISPSEVARSGSQAVANICATARWQEYNARLG